MELNSIERHNYNTLKRVLLIMMLIALIGTFVLVALDGQANARADAATYRYRIHVSGRFGGCSYYANEYRIEEGAMVLSGGVRTCDGEKVDKLVIMAMDRALAIEEQ